MTSLQRALRSLALVLALVLAALAPACTPGSAAGAASRDEGPLTVVMVSLDGVRWDYPSRDRLPAFAAMAGAGLSAERLLPPFPSLTSVCHATLATGCYPDKHGIVANAFLDAATRTRFSKNPEASWLEEPPLWVLCERAGQKAAVSKWPSSAGPWKGVAPSYYRPFDRDAPDPGTVPWILDLLGKPARTRPRLVMAWTGGADEEGHDQGPDGPAVHAAMRRIDRDLAALRAGIAALGPRTRVALCVLSDHGMAAVKRRVDVVPLVPKHAFFPYVATSSAVVNIYVDGEAQADAVAEGLRGLPPDVALYRKGKAPANLHAGTSERFGEFLLAAPPGTVFAAYGRKTQGPPPAGMHGYYVGDCPDVAGIFYLEGPGVPGGKVLPEVREVDVAPTVCALLGLKPPPHADGRNVLAP